MKLPNRHIYPLDIPFNWRCQCKCVRGLFNTHAFIKMFGEVENYVSVIDYYSSSVSKLVFDIQDIVNDSDPPVSGLELLEYRAMFHDPCEILSWLFVNAESQKI